MLGGCHHGTPTESDPLIQRGYLWQRAWTPAVVNAMQDADRRLNGVVVLGAEMVWQGKVPRVIEANISWDDLKTASNPCALTLRIAPYPGPFLDDDAAAHAITGEAVSLLGKAKAHGVTLSEFQVDFDCGQQKLAGYRTWLHSLAKIVHPTRLVITTLPVWLNEAEFPALIHETDGYVLQVHSVPTMAESGRAVLCDPVLARKWVAEASRLGKPFWVALPTYWCLAGYDPAGKLIGVAMDGVQPSWPAGTRTLEFASNADKIAELVTGWQAERPAEMRGIIWYRVPVATDLRNWRWPTLLAVMAGRSPAHHLEVIHEGAAPVDFSVVNSGEAEEELNCDMVARWSDSRVVACDALPGWAVSTGPGKAVFTTLDGYRLRLLPGDRMGIGWIRFEKPTALQTEWVPHGAKSP
jgi:Protein of unknown function (DUF3142)